MSADTKKHNFFSSSTANKAGEDVASHLNQNPTVWENFSKEAITKVCESLKDNQLLIELLPELGKFRQCAAQKIGQTHEHWDRIHGWQNQGHEPFGQFVTPNYLMIEGAENINKVKPKIIKELNSKSTAFHRLQRPVVKKGDSLPNLLRNEKTGKFEQARAKKSDETCYYTFYFTLPGGKVTQPQQETLNKLIDFIDKHHQSPVEKKHVQQAFEQDSFAPHLSCIRAEKAISKSFKSRLKSYKNGGTKIEFSGFQYPSLSATELLAHYARCEELFASLKSWDTSRDLGEFIESAAKLAYILAHRLPFRRGTASIVEWLIKGIAEARGIENFPQRIAEQLGDHLVNWPVYALAEPDIDKYVDWYKAAVKQSLDNTQQYDTNLTAKK